MQDAHLRQQQPAGDVAAAAHLQHVEHLVPLLQAVDDAKAGQEEQRPGQAQLRRAEARRGQPDGQAHAEEGQAIEEVDDDEIALEEVGH